MPVVFDPPANFKSLPAKERRALRRAWRKLPETKEARAVARAKTQDWFEKWVLSPVLPLVGVAAQTALDDGLDGQDAIDDAVDYLIERLDALADFSFLPIGTPIAEAASDALIAAASQYLEDRVREAINKLIGASPR